MVDSFRTTEGSVYSQRSGLILGFHGTDESIVHEIVLNRQSIKFSENPWDWIGHGAYFWEHSPQRALDFARNASKRGNSMIRNPAVLGAVLDLGHCLDLIDYENMGLIKDGYELVKSRNAPLPENKTATTGVNGELLIRDLDCAVVEMIHQIRLLNHREPFDSVKAVFWEGNLLYPNAGFREKNHIQICIRNPNCIKGFFIPRSQQISRRPAP